MKKSKVVAIIPARGGSKRVKNKNIKTFNGLPLIIWTLVEAFKTFEIDDVFVSTDSKKIIQIVEYFGFSIIKRPLELANDDASSDVVLLHALKELGVDSYAILAFIQCTNPFENHSTYSSVISNLIKNKKCSNTFASSKFKGWLWENKGEASVGYNHKKEVRKRSQDIDWSLHIERGSIVGIRIPDFLKSENRFSGITNAVLSDNKFNIDIDTETDFLIAEEIFKAKRKFSKFKNIKIIFTDFDGVISNNKVSTDQNGNEFVNTSKSDSMILNDFKSQVEIIVISSEISGTTKKRCEKIGLNCYDSIKNKKQLIKEIVYEKGYNWSETAYVGNDLNDLIPIILCGYSFAPIDSESIVLGAVNEIIPVNGGEGVLRFIYNKYFNLLH